MAVPARARETRGKLAILCCGIGVAAALTLAPAAVARAPEVRYASPGAGGPEPCAQSAPCSLPDAVNGHSLTDVIDGDQVIVMPGTYHPGSKLDVRHAMNVGGEAGAPVPAVEGTGSVASVVLSDHAGALVHDLRVDQGIGGLGTNALVVLNGGSAERVYATNFNGGAACPIGGGTLRDSVCSVTGGGSAEFTFPSGGLVEHVVLRNVTALGTGAGAIGIEFETEDPGSVASLDAVNVIARGDSADVRATTDSSANAGAALSFSHSNYATATHSGSGATVTPAGTNGNQTAAPHLSANFQELAGSPTIDAGLAAPDIGSLDLDRSPRSVSGVPACTEPQPGPPDIGAFELVPAPLVSPSCISNSISNKFSFSVKGKKLLVAVEASGTVAVSDAAAKLSASAARKKRKLLLKASSGSGDPPTITVPLNLSKAAKSRLKKKGKVTVNARITFTPRGGLANTQTARLKIKLKRVKK